MMRKIVVVTKIVVVARDKEEMKRGRPGMTRSTASRAARGAKEREKVCAGLVTKKVICKGIVLKELKVVSERAVKE